MASVFEVFTLKEQRSVVHFLRVKGNVTKYIHKETVYSENCLFRQAVYNWIQKFSDGCLNTIDKELSGSSIHIEIEKTLRKVKKNDFRKIAIIVSK